MTRARVLLALLLLFSTYLLVAPLAAAPPGGTPICQAAGAQSNPVAVSDGAGGMIVTWLDARRGVADLYAHHLASGAALDPAWSPDGNPVTQSGSASVPTIFGDGQGGALVVWFDPAASAVTAQHVQGSGSLAPGWPASGRSLVTESVSGPSGRIFRWSADPTGNLYVCWNTYDFIEHLWLQRFGANGMAIWAAPVEVASAGPGGGRFTFADVGASSQGAVVVWGSFEDLPIGSSAPAAASHYLPNGGPGVQTDLVAPFGNPLTVTTFVTGIAVDAAGTTFVRERVNGVVHLLKLDPAGAILWPADRNIATAGRLIPDDAGGVYALASSGVSLDRRAADGSVPAGWTGSGLTVTSATTSGAVSAAIVSGGILLCWADDARGHGADVRATVITNSGAIAPGWRVGGSLISSVHGVQSSPTVVATTAGTGLAAWQDLRRKGGGDIYGDVVAPVAAVGPNLLTPDDTARFESSALGAGVEPEPERDVAFSVSAAPVESGVVRVRFTLAESGEATLDVVDVTGRLLRRQFATGAHGLAQITTLVAGELPRGIYWIRLQQGSRQASAKLLNLRLSP